jgi:protein involved in ribonucleotide reduction
MIQTQIQRRDQYDVETHGCNVSLRKKRETKRRLKPFIPMSPSNIQNPEVVCAFVPRETIGIMRPAAGLSLCEKCGEREATHEHHTIFDSKTNKSEKDSPKINICALCHAKIHGISPQISEIRMLVQEYIRIQKVRMQYDNVMRGFSHIEMKVPEFFQQQSENLNKYEVELSKKIKQFLEREDQQKIETHSSYVFPIYSWLKNIKGISHLLSAQLIAFINIEKFDNVAKLWAYCGMAVSNGKAPKRSKGSKINWNPQLRMICYKLGDSFIKQRTPKYRDIYDIEKEKQVKLLGETRHGMKSKNVMSHSKLKKEEEDHKVNETHILFVSLPQSLGHADMRARRKAVKEFLKDLYIEWRSLKSYG